MSIVEVLLVFAGIPLAVYLIFVIGVYLPHAARARRYRPGDPWEYDPVWFVPQLELLDADTQTLLAPRPSGLPEIEAAGTPTPAIAAPGYPTKPAGAPTATALRPPLVTARGGARGDW